MSQRRMCAFVKSCLGVGVTALLLSLFSVSISANAEQNAAAPPAQTHTQAQPESTSGVESLPTVKEPSRLSTGQELDVTSSVMQVVMGLGVIILVILVLAWLLKRVYRWQAPQQSMKVVSSLALGTRERALLIDVKGQQMLLGVTAQQVTLLKAFDEPVMPVESVGKPSAFAEQLAEVIRSKKEDQKEPNDDSIR